MLECECCCGEYAFESLVQCSEGHLFCKICIQKYTEESVFGNGKSKLKCMSSSSDCQGFFSDSMLKMSLSERVFKAYQELLAQNALKEAKLENMITCHNCQLPVELPANAGILLRCPMCTFQTCRLCGEKAHIPLKCSEVEKDSETKQRLSVEEAMSKARIRECPRCKTRFFKVEGCNKMTCNCGYKMCYICRADLTKIGYAHFCSKPHCGHRDCKKCVMYSDSVEDDRLAAREAGLQTIKAIESTVSAVASSSSFSSSSSSSSSNHTLSKIDIDKLLEPSLKTSINKIQNRPPGMR